jgi:aromatic ring hydroxylase
VWHGGRRIADVTTHSGFTGTIRTLADIYDRQHRPEYRDIMTIDYRHAIAHNWRSSGATSSFGRN